MSRLYTLDDDKSAAGTVRGIWRSLLRWPLYGLMRLLGVRVEGLENIPPDGTAGWSSPTTCTTSTHLLIEIAFPRPLHFMAKEELFRFRPLGWIIRRFGNFRLRAARATAGGAARHRHAAARDRAGDVPRGNAQQDDATRPGTPGAGLIALQGKSFVLPVAVTGSERLPLNGKRPPGVPRIRGTEA